MAGAAPGQKRIMKEYRDLSSSSPPGITVNDSGDLMKWKVTMDGPPGSPYAGGKFDLDITLPQNYPFKPPTLQFTTKIYHPNISNESPPNTGMMCLGMLRESEWKPATKMSAVLAFAQNLLSGMVVPCFPYIEHNPFSTGICDLGMSCILNEILVDGLEPNLDDPVEAKIADQIKTDKMGFDKEAREWTKKYATGAGSAGSGASKKKG